MNLSLPWHQSSDLAAACQREKGGKSLDGKNVGREDKKSARHASCAPRADRFFEKEDRA